MEYKGITSKYQNWEKWQEIMFDLTFNGISNQKAAKIADGAIEAMKEKMAAKISR